MELPCGEWSGAHDPGTLCRQARACRARRSVRSTSPSINSSFCCFTGGPGTLLLAGATPPTRRHARSCRTGLCGDARSVRPRGRIGRTLQRAAAVVERRARDPTQGVELVRIGLQRLTGEVELDLDGPLR